MSPWKNNKNWRQIGAGTVGLVEKAKFRVRTFGSQFRKEKAVLIRTRFADAILRIRTEEFKLVFHLPG